MKKIIVLIILTFTLINCGGGDSNSNEYTRDATLDDVESILSNISAYSIFTDALKYTNNQLKGIRADGITNTSRFQCDSGYIDITPDANNILSGENMRIVTISKYVNCKIDDVTFDGDVKYKYTTDSSYMECLSDFKFKNILQSKLKKGSTISIQEKNGQEVTTINIMGLDNGKSFGGRNLIFYNNDETNPAWLYPLSGEEIVADNVTFRVDPNYDASKTPFESNDQNILKGGLFQYLDSKGHIAQIELTDNNEITVRLDINGDGVFDREEEKIVKNN